MLNYNIGTDSPHIFKLKKNQLKRDNLVGNELSPLEGGGSQFFLVILTELALSSGLINLNIYDSHI